MNPICKVSTCDRPVAEAHVCMRCAHNLERALGDIPAVTHQLNLTLAKQAAFADRNERVGAETPLPLDMRASATASDLRAHLVAWVKLVHETRGIYAPTGTYHNPEPSLDALSRWMLHHVEWLRHHEAGHDCVDELVTDVRTARRVIDVPPNRTTFAVGPCPDMIMRCEKNMPAYNAPCPGEVRAYIPNTEETPARLECTWCRTVWEPWQWLRAGRRILDRKATMRGTAA